MLLNVEKLKQNYDVLDKELHDIWKDSYFSSGKYSGHGGTIYKTIKPENYDDFYIRQQEYAKKNIKLSISDRGLLKNELENLAFHFKNFCEKKNHNLNYDLQNYIDYIMYVNYIQTFDGKEGEKKIVKWLKQHGFNAELTSKIFDDDYGIDIIYDDKNGIQLKSYFFLLSNKKSVLNDIEELKEKYEKALEELDIKTYYVFFDKKMGKYVSFKNNKILTDFKTLKEILDMDLKERKKYLSKLKRIDLP